MLYFVGGLGCGDIMLTEIIRVLRHTDRITLQ